MKRPYEPLTYTLSGSMLTHFRPRPSAAAPVVLLPAKGSNTRSSLRVRNFMKNSATPICIRAGCGLRFFLRQNSWYLSVDEVLENGSTFEGIAPPLFVRKDRFPTRCPDGRLPELYCFDL